MMTRSSRFCSESTMDLKGKDHPQKLVANLPPYTLSNLGPSYVSISLLERLYYYVLRDAHPDLVVQLNMLHMYLKGKLIFAKQWVNRGQSCVKEEDIDRFKYSSGVSSLKADINECLRVQLVHRAGKEGEHNSMNKGHENISDGECIHVEINQQEGKKGEHDSVNQGQETISSGESLHVKFDHMVAGEDGEYDSINKGQEMISNGECPSTRSQQTYKKKRVDNSPPIPMFPQVLPSKHHKKRKDLPKRMYRSNESTVMPLLSIPDVEDSDLDPSLHLTGTA
ncbi:hypothetical protein L6164_032507 [Bauhinia variegata]|uniref:Uncharacterized protein n=1 Tax=Bauhinia variegata TaxID=167791 RepID=A0ACB9KPQ9_BAUVA|nr:hypothetical protein L6164_032507 [Bauhinia variegata]